MIAKNFSVDLVSRLISDLKAANTETAKKERFQQYLTQAFAGDEAAQTMISSMTLGAERSILRIPRTGKSDRGRADTQTTELIIEWEKDLSKTGFHAIDQLKEYLAGNWNSGLEYRYRLITTDGLRWRFYAPDWTEFGDQILEMGTQFQLKEIQSFDLSPNTAAEFPYFLDAQLFVTSAKKPTLENIMRDFGDTSEAFINSRLALRRCLDQEGSSEQLKVCMEQWHSFLSIAYGQYDASPQKFFVHTYLSVFSKMIAFKVLSDKDYVHGDLLKRVLDGSEFNKFNIDRFVENDFFFWVSKEPYFSVLTPMFSNIQKALGDYDLTEFDEDILKGVYQELIDLDTKHALGEYYTPDWLCDNVLSNLALKPGMKVLDPACGSGSFLRVAAKKLLELDPEYTAKDIAGAVHGIDIHPLSVQISKTTLLLALIEKIKKSDTPISFNVYLANSLTVPRGQAELFQSRFSVSVDHQQIEIDLQGIRQADQFDKVVSICSDLAQRPGPEIIFDEFDRMITGNVPSGVSPTLPRELFLVYRAMKQAVEKNRDSIWKFILQNSYKPVFLQNYFDVVIGNPPWLTYADIANPIYQNILQSLAHEYDMTPRKKTNMPHLDIAALFLAHGANYFLKDGGKIGFVLPRSFMSADQHDPIRRQLVPNLKIDEVWDLQDVSPLFRVPTCVLFGSRRSSGRKSATSVLGRKLSGRLPRAQVQIDLARTLVKSAEVVWQLAEIGNKKTTIKSAWAIGGSNPKGANAYHSQFKQGATILPRTFYFVEIDSAYQSASVPANAVLSVTSEPEQLKSAKSPWTTPLVGRCEGSFLFRTAISRSILPFSLSECPMVLMPLKQKNDGSFKLLDTSDLLANGAVETSRWFADAERMYMENRTGKAEEAKLSMLGRLNYQQGVTAQSARNEFLVLYTSSSKDASAVVVTSQDFDLTFIADHKAYWCSVSTHAEADFVCAFLNSRVSNKKIKEFQTQGLMGPRDVHKVILNLPWPRFRPKDAVHRRIAEIGNRCAHISREISLREGFTNERLGTNALGRARSLILREIEAELHELDSLIEQIWGDKNVL
jgi:type I restriction-modification system DNA methylase subunit